MTSRWPWSSAAQFLWGRHRSDWQVHPPCIQFSLEVASDFSLHCLAISRFFFVFYLFFWVTKSTYNNTHMNLVTILRTKTNCNTALILHSINNRSTKSETKKKLTVRGRGQIGKWWGVELVFVKAWDFRGLCGSRIGSRARPWWVRNVLPFQFSVFSALHVCLGLFRRHQ